ncbi:hypothetical protein RB601_002834 [Gaeumannomyces tritici]
MRCFVDMRSGRGLGLLALAAQAAAQFPSPFGLPYFIPCAGYLYKGGNVCPSDAFCWFIGIQDWALCAPCSRDPSRCPGQPQPPQPPPNPSDVLSTIDFFGNPNCGGSQVTFTNTGRGGGFSEGGCNYIPDIFRSARVAVLANGCTVEIFTDTGCSRDRIVARTGQCLNANGNWASYRTSNCARKV